MKYEIKDAKLVEILKERGSVLTKAKELQKEVEKLQKEQQKLGYKMNRLKDKTAPFVEKNKKDWEIKEFDYVARIFVEKDKAYAEIKNQLEDYKELLREKSKEEEKK